MAESPKRRKCKDNPYTLNYIEEKNIYTITFKDVKGHLNKVEVSEEVYRVFDKFELQDIKELNEYDRHIEHSEIFENNLESRALNKQIPTDEIVENKINNEKLRDAIQELPKIQRTTLTMKEAAEYLGVSYWLINQLVRRKQIPCSKVGGKYLFRVQALDEYLKNMEQKSIS